MADTNYRELQALYERLAPRGFVVFGFPCGQFGQEPGSPPEIRAFANKYDITFPMFAKVDANGLNGHPFYGYLKSNCDGVLGGRDVEWNFAKFLVGRDGRVLSRYTPNRTPSSIEDDILKALGATAINR